MDPLERPDTEGRRAVRWVIQALLVAVLQLILLRGVSGGLVALFLVPPLLALAACQSPAGTIRRRLGTAFLVLVGIGVAVSRLPALLPGLGGVDRGLPRVQDRLLTWYSVVYIVFLIGVVPAVLFTRSLAARRRGEAAPFSRPTCYLGIAAMCILWPAVVPVLGGLLGLWPLPK